MANEVKLRSDDIKAIIDVLEKSPEVEQGILFGSRAKGNSRNGSDVDIAVKGEHIDYKAISHISYLLNEETTMPYHFDVLNYHTIKSRELLDHIERVGITIYQK
ncbi:MAG: nucleotidyltransferase domain-containing protein [Bacteroidales bacterium]|nr:nucleotidyltransferase domain-containing protein [Bacteroidales bacterium]MCF8333666.1 nucleotidyltransferase domain-containing protein [Bacteroidales bacterium]